ncbi:precorrin-3B synthase [Micromonospora sp. WMMD1082]|uniref:precorrin-3B synthase n=1 Tax=Micromonospora sp. WMMD1082 TaxID=3016104 RepID=UPI002415BC89|nr:precorrin-3B synthase [Micromonospora sp. WMMD1082]MDG4797120.1 precorrin-3B synthase [Micromonospora sp. WMMD1082]
MSAVSSPSGRPGDDRCPGLLRAHQAADGLLVRVRIPGGQLGVPQLRRLAEAARRYADGTLELTSRGNVQLRGIPDLRTVDRVATVLVESGLLPSASHERVRNIVASPLSGLDRRGHADVRPVVAAVDAALCAAADLADLSGRFLVALDDGRGDVTGLGADLCWTADTGALLVAGRDLGLRANAGEVADAVVTAARAFLRQRADRRDVWRIADLPQASPAIVAALRGPHTHPATASHVAPPEPAPPPHPGPPAAAPSHAAPPRVVPPQAAPPPVGPYPDGFVVAAARLGRLTAGQADAVAALACASVVVVTPWRTLVVSGPPEAAALRLAEAGLVVDPASPWVGVTACAGRPGCGSALADVRADATAALTVAAPPAANAPAAGALAADAPPAVGPSAEVPAADALPLHWAGCDRCCGRPAGPAVLAVATGAGYRVASPRGDHHGPLAERVAQARRPS